MTFETVCFWLDFRVPMEVIGGLLIALSAVFWRG